MTRWLKHVYIYIYSPDATHIKSFMIRSWKWLWPLPDCFVPKGNASSILDMMTSFKFNPNIHGEVLGVVSDCSGALVGRSRMRRARRGNLLDLNVESMCVGVIAVNQQIKLHHCNKSDCTGCRFVYNLFRKMKKIRQVGGHWGINLDFTQMFFSAASSTLAAQ